jgi:predicted phosphodiesterase
VRYALLADVHGNLNALRAIIAALRRRGVERWVVAGDVVGYGAYPNECVEAVADLGAVCVAGNHDLIALGRMSDEGISAPARMSLRWTSARLSDSSRRFLAGLPLSAVLDDALVITHGSLDSVSEYVTKPRQAARQLERMRREHPRAQVLVVGHTHRPWAWSRSRGGTRGAWLPLKVPQREPLLLNPGSVGQSRELRVRARGAVLDLDVGRNEFVSAQYDFERYRVELSAAGLPPEGCHYISSVPRVGLRNVRRVVFGY